MGRDDSRSLNRSTVSVLSWPEQWKGGGEVMGVHKADGALPRPRVDRRGRWRSQVRGWGVIEAPEPNYGSYDPVLSGVATSNVTSLFIPFPPNYSPSHTPSHLLAPRPPLPPATFNAAPPPCPSHVRRRGTARRSVPPLQSPGHADQAPRHRSRYTHRLAPPWQALRLDRGGAKAQAREPDSRPLTTRPRRTAASSPCPVLTSRPRLLQTIGFNIQGNGSAIDSFYYAKVWVGTPPSVFNLIIDTGSSDMILPGEACTSCNHKTLGPLSSSTFVGSAVPWNITYNNGQASGTLATDTVTVADLTLVNHNFGVILASASGFNLTSFAYDGVLGTGPSFASQEQAATVPQAIFSRRLASGVTGYRLGRSQDPTK